MRLQLRHDGDRQRDDSFAPTACRHEWTAAYLPMEVGSLAKLLEGARCPMCGGDAGIKVVEAREPGIGDSGPFSGEPGR